MFDMIYAEEQKKILNIDISGFFPYIFYKLKHSINEKKISFKLMKKYKIYNCDNAFK